MKSIDEIFEEMKQVFRERSGAEISGWGDMAARLYASAAVLSGLSHQLDWLQKQSFPQTAEGEQLDLHAQMRGVTRQEAAQATGRIRFSVTQTAEQDREIPAGTVCMTAGQVRFETLEEAVLPAGANYVDVDARALVPGRSGNVAAGSIRFPDQAPVGVERCDNPAAFSGGVDRETDGELRQRILESYARLPNGANAAFYESVAMGCEGVAAAKAVGRARGVGTVDVLISGPGGLPEQAAIQRVQEKLEQMREIAVDVRVRAPEAVTVNLNLQVAVRESMEEAEVLEQVKSAIRNWFDGRRLGKPVLLAQLGSLIYAVEGVENYRFLTPTADVAVEGAQLPMAGNLTVSGMEAV